MKRIKLLSPILGLTAITTAIAPLASCSCNQTEEGAKANLTVTSTDGVTIKEASVELNKDSTVTLNVPTLKAISTMYINVGSTVLTEDKDFTIDYNNNIVKINASAMTNKDVNITIFTTKMTGICATLAQSKTYEAFDTIKASDLVIKPVYLDATKVTKTLTYGSEYLVYGSDGKEIKDFDTTGYQITRADGTAGSKLFNIKFLTKDYTTSLSITTEPRMEPKSIDWVYNNKGLFVNDTVTVDDLTVDATMSKEPLSKVLEYGTDYLVYDENGKLIENFGNDGYTFTTVGKHTLTVKSTLNPEEAYKDVIFDVLPEKLRGATCATNTGNAEAKLSWTVDYDFEWTTINPNFEYSTDYGENWTTFVRDTPITIKPNCSVALRGDNTTGFTALYHSLSVGWTNLTFAPNEEETSKKKININIFGSIMGLMDKNGEGTKVETLPQSCFEYLFDRSKITSVSKGYLGNPKLSQSCYGGMFSGSSIVNAPSLPSTELANGCYGSMFIGCEKLKSAPDLPATQLEYSCYSYMFNGCSSLTNVPKLSATKLTDYCYVEMFRGCTNLKISNSAESGGSLFFTCPDIEGLDDPVTDMFTETGGSYTSSPVVGESYYCY